MQGQGIVRKLDELGRIVIPKEMRKTLNIKEGSDIEIILNGETILLKKFSLVFNILNEGEKLIESLYDTLNLPCLLCDNEKIVCVKGVSKKDYLDVKFEKATIEALSKPGEIKHLMLSKTLSVNGYNLPILSDGFVIGYIIVLSDGLKEKEVTAIKLCTSYISKLIG